jgi:hypothetical protein
MLTTVHCFVFTATAVAATDQVQRLSAKRRRLSRVHLSNSAAAAAN